MKKHRPDYAQLQLKLFAVLAGLGLLAQFNHVHIPHTDVLIDGRWAFGFMGFALLRRWWTALLLAACLSTPWGSDVPFGIGLAGNLAYAIPSLLLIRMLHGPLLRRLGASWGYALAWTAMVLLCYQAFTTPVVWGVLGLLEGASVLDKVMEGWRTQPFLIESVLVAVFSATAMVAYLSNVKLRSQQRHLEHVNRLLLGIRNVNQLIIAEDDPHRLIQRACVNLTETVGYLNAWIALLDESGHVADLAASGFDEEVELLRSRLEEGQYPECMRHAMQCHQTTVVADPPAHCRDCPVAESYAGRAGFCHRLHHGGKTYGVLAVSVPAAYATDDQEQSLFEEVAGDLAFALHKIEAARDLDESRAMLERTEGIANVGSWQWDIEQDRVRWSAELFRIFGRDPAQGAPTFAEHGALYVPEDMARLQQAVSACATEGEPYELELRAIRLDGEMRYCVARGRPLPEADGKIRRLVGSLQDITDRKQAEGQLRHFHDLMHYIIEHANSAVAVHDKEMRYIYVSQQYLDQYDVHDRDVIGKHHYEVFPDLPQKWRDAHRRALAGEVCRADRDPYVRSDGTVEWTRWECRPWYDADGSIGGVIVYTEMITDRVRQEDERAEQQALLEAIYRNAPLVMMVVDGDRRVQQVNGFATQFAGKQAEEMLGLRGGEALRCLHALDDPAGCGFGEVCQECIIRNTVLDTLEQGAAHLQVEAPFYLSEEQGVRQLTLLVSTAPIAVKGSRMALVTMQDVSERKKAELALREGQRRLQTLMSNLPGMAYRCLHEPNWKMDFVSEGCVALTGYRPEDLLRDGSVNYADLIHPDDRQRVWETVNSAVKNGNPFVLEYRIQDRTGDTRWVWERGSVVLAEPDGQTVLEGFIADITDRKAAEETEKQLQDQLAQAQKMEAVGRLAGGVAHDFNNMLQTILGYCDMLLTEAGSDHPFRESLAEIRKAGTRSADLTRQLLAFARKQTVSPVVLDINAAVSDALKMLHRLIGEDIDLNWQPSRDKGLVSIDPAQVDQILANLIVNARDAIAGNGRITIETNHVEFDEEYCRAHQGFREGRYEMLAVSDDGVGMDRQTLDQVFEPFFTTKDKEKGTGLGLATVYGIVKQNDGFINIYSEPGQGTTVRVYLPAVMDGRESPRRTATDGDLPTGTETVLLVEDEPALLKLSQQVLEGLGYRVLAASAPQEALSIAADLGCEFDVLITDVVMPQMSGKELQKQLAEHCPDLRCLFMSGYTENVIAHHGVLEEGVHFLQKPFSTADLARKLREVLSEQP